MLGNLPGQANKFVAQQSCLSHRQTGNFVVQQQIYLFARLCCAYDMGLT